MFLRLLCVVFWFLGIRKCRLRNTPYCCAVHTFAFISKGLRARYCSFLAVEFLKDCPMYVINRWFQFYLSQDRGKLSEQHHQRAEVLPRLVMKDILGLD